MAEWAWLSVSDSSLSFGSLNGGGTLRMVELGSEAAEAVELLGRIFDFREDLEEVAKFGVEEEAVLVGPLFEGASVDVDPAKNCLGPVQDQDLVLLC